MDIPGRGSAARKHSEQSGFMEEGVGRRGKAVGWSPAPGCAVGGLHMGREQAQQIFEQESDMMKSSALGRFILARLCRIFWEEKEMRWGDQLGDFGLCYSTAERLGGLIRGQEGRKLCQMCGH